VYVRGSWRTLSDMSSDNRVPVTVRLTPTGLAEIDRMATDEERDRSSMIRLLLKEAVAARTHATPTRNSVGAAPLRTVKREEKV
jgi:hypothetical protein